MTRALTRILRNVIHPVLLIGCAHEEATPPPMPETPLQEVKIEAGSFSGVILDNLANSRGEGAGFHPLFHDAYPGKAIFRPELVGLNFEHIFNGAAADKDRSMFTPRKDPCELRPLARDRFSITWRADQSSWDMDCQMFYEFREPNAIDLTFEATPRANHFPHGYAALMWASYMNRTRERRIHFIGRESGGPEQWISFGDDLAEGFETGTVACDGVPSLPYEEGAQTLNLIESKAKTFTKPFYYGVIDGDNDLSTTNDTLVFIMMFDHAEPIRFAVWNFIKDESGKPDPHSPAWDWQFVIHRPELNKQYGYKARVIIKPFSGRDDALREYEAWAGR